MHRFLARISLLFLIGVPLGALYSNRTIRRRISPWEWRTWRRKEYFRASVCFEKVLRKNPNEPAALNNLAIAYVKMGKAEKALDCAERAAQVHPNSVEIKRTLAEIRKNVSKK